MTALLRGRYKNWTKLPLIFFLQIKEIKTEVFSKRLRPTDEMIKDPDFHLRIGRLVGAAEMAGHVLSHEESAQAKHVGEHLQFVADWFFVNESLKLPKG